MVSIIFQKNFEGFLGFALKTPCAPFRFVWSKTLAKIRRKAKKTLLKGRAFNFRFAATRSLEKNKRYSLKSLLASPKTTNHRKFTKPGFWLTAFCSGPWYTSKNTVTSGSSNIPNVVKRSYVVVWLTKQLFSSVRLVVSFIFLCLNPVCFRCSVKHGDTESYRKSCSRHP